MVMLIVIIFGAISYTRLPVDLFPQMEIPYAVVVTSYEGAGPSEVESLVTKPLEQTLGTTSKLKNIYSTSSNGNSQVILEFEDGTDMNFASLEVREKVDLISGALPDGAGEPMVLKIDVNAEPVMTIGVSSHTDLVKLKQMIEDNIQPRLERISGVASVELSGAKEKEIQITLLSDQVNAYGLTTNQIAGILRAENINLPIGDIERGSQTLNIRSIGEFESLEDIKNVPIQTPTGANIYLRDIAIVEETFKEMDSYSYMNGEPAIILQLQKQSTANTVDVTREVYKEINKLEKEYEELQFKYLSDQGEEIQASIDSVIRSALLGGILAVIVLYIFLRNFRSTLIVGISIPVSVIFTFCLMYYGGMTLNVISLGGLSMGLGMLVDNSIVVLENVFRHQEDGVTRKEAANIGVSEVSTAVVASTLTTIAVFLPMTFAEGMIATIFRDMSLTVTFSLLASLAVALTVVPMLCSKLLNVDRSRKKRKNIFSKILDGWGHVLDKIDGLYRVILNWVMHHRKSSVALVLVLFLATVSVVPMVGMEFMPPMDAGEFSVSISLPQGSNMEKTFEIVDRVEAEIEHIPEVKDMNVTVREGSANIRVDVGSMEERERKTDVIADEVRGKVVDKIAGAEISVNANMMSMTGGTPIAIQIIGDDFDTLHEIADDFVEIVESVEGTREVSSSFSEGVYEAQIYINRQRAALYGLSTQSVASSIQNAVTGYVATQYKIDGTELDVRIVYDPSEIEYIKDVQNITIATPSGGSILLSDVGEIVVEKTPSSISRENNKRIITVSSNLIGVDTNTAQQQINEKLINYNMPDGYTYDFGGDYEEMVESFSSLGLVLILAIVLVYMVLASQFESLLHPFVIMFSVPLALTGAILALFATGNTLNMPSVIGMIMLVGIVVNNAIVLIDYINQLRAKGHTRLEAILLAGPTRLRPILMTTLTTVLAMVPLSLGLGEGTEMMSSMGIAVIGGLTMSTLFTLVIIPLNYTLFDDISRKLRRKKKHEM